MAQIQAAQPSIHVPATVLAPCFFVSVRLDSYHSRVLRMLAKLLINDWPLCFVFYQDCIWLILRQLQHAPFKPDIPIYHGALRQIEQPLCATSHYRYNMMGRCVRQLVRCVP